MLGPDRSTNRRHFVKGSTAAILAGYSGLHSTPALGLDDSPECCDRTYASVEEAIKAPPETLAYLPGIYSGTGVEQPDYLATVDLDVLSPTYGKIIHRLYMPNLNDELHHFGWNSCSSCHGQAGAGRRYIVLPGIASSRIHIIDTLNPREPALHKVLEPEYVKGKSGLSAPHTVHCLASGEIMISMLGDADGEAPGGFLLLDENFEIKGRWERDATGMKLDESFFVDFGLEPHGPARAHEVRFSTGDSTSDIWS